MTSALIVTKLRIPVQRGDLVSRSHLPHRLDRGLEKKLTLISAPAGFGKTTLTVQWALRQQEDPCCAVSWLTLDSGDNDLVRFLHYLLATLQKAVPPIAEKVRPLLETIQPAQVEGVLTTLINQIDAHVAENEQKRILLVLDDYHLITGGKIHQVVSFILRHQPPSLHLTIVTRADPPLPLARWRARGQLLELRQQDLRFTLDEAAEFFQQNMALSIPVADVQTINRRTEGWIAGLQMAAIAMQTAVAQSPHALSGQAETDAFVQSFRGSHRYVLDYLMEEVLARQPAQVKNFLLQTAVLNKMCASICDAITAAESPGSQAILEQLEAANLFLVPLDDERRWYRYHRLFADLLRKRLQETRAEEIPGLHRRAADWFAANGFVEEAIAHALQAGAAGQAADLIAGIADEMLMRSELVTVKRWLAALPRSERVKRPSLSLYYAWALIMDGSAESEVDRALGPVVAGGAPGEISLVQSLQAIIRGNGAAAVELAAQSLSQLAPERSFLHGVATWILGVSQLFVGEVEAGMQTLEKAVHFSRLAGNLAMAVASLGRLANQAWREGDLYRARRIYRQALALATDEEEQPLPIAGETLIALARLYYEWNDLQAAYQYAVKGVSLSEQWRELAGVSGYLWQARIKSVLGDDQAAREALALAAEIARRSAGTELDDLAVAMWETQLHLQQGNTNAALAWAADRGLADKVDPHALRRHEDLVEGHLRKYEYILLARIRLAQAQPAAAMALLKPLLADARRLVRIDLQLEIHILMALASWGLHDAAAADEQMAAALALGQPGGFIRLFVEAGPEMEMLLTRQQPAEQAGKTYRRQLLDACGKPSAGHGQSPSILRQPLLEPLSERELEVLALIAGGLSNREIAQQLVISLPTVKWHTSNIYGKLDVGNRTMAVARARDLEILP